MEISLLCSLMISFAFVLFGSASGQIMPMLSSCFGTVERMLLVPQQVVSTVGSIAER